MSKQIIFFECLVHDSIGQKVRRLRLRQDFSQMLLAEQAQISVSTSKRIESGVISNFDALVRVLRVLGELDVFAPLIKEEKMSPNEYYEFMESLKKKQRKRASSKRNTSQTSKEED